MYFMYISRIHVQTPTPNKKNTTGSSVNNIKTAKHWGEKTPRESSWSRRRGASHLRPLLISTTNGPLKVKPNHFVKKNAPGIVEEIYVFVTGRISRKTRDSWLFEWSTWSGTPPVKTKTFCRASQIFSNDSLPGCTWECGHLHERMPWWVFYWYDIHITYILYKYHISIPNFNWCSFFSLQSATLHLNIFSKFNCHILPDPSTKIQKRNP